MFGFGWIGRFLEVILQIFGIEIDLCDVFLYSIFVDCYIFLQYICVEFCVKVNVIDATISFAVLVCKNFCDAVFYGISSVVPFVVFPAFPFCKTHDTQRTFIYSIHSLQDNPISCSVCMSSSLQYII